MSSQSELLRYLQRPVTLTWRGAPIHSSLHRLSDLYQIGVVVDRRVDPATELNLSIQQSAFLRVVVAAAAQSDLYVEVIGPCVYVGPPSSARLGPLLLEIANEKVTALPSRKRVHWQSRHAIQFARLDDPRTKIKEVAVSAGVPISNPEAIPHDLWRAQRWPNLTMAESLTLVLIGFDMTFDVTAAGGCRIIPIDRRTRITHTHRANLSAQQQTTLQEKFPGARWTRRGIELDANLDAHGELLAWIRESRKPKQAPQPLPASPSLPQSYSIEIKNQPLEPIVKGVLQRINMKVAFDEGIPQEILGQRISFKVTGATRDELLKAMLEKSGLVFTIDENTVRIQPK